MTSPPVSLRGALSSWRAGSVTLLSFASGLPLGLVWIALPDWMRASGIDIRVVGLITLAQAPWSFKLLWAPLMARWEPGLRGRLRSWMLVTQVALAALTAALGLAAGAPELAWVILALATAIAFASASQDVVIDAYAVEVLEAGERGLVVGARTAVYRAAMFASGALSISLTATWSWKAVCLLQAALYLPMLAVSWYAPAAPVLRRARRSLRQEVWEPFVGMMTRPRAIEILGFVLLYKLADALSQSLLRPFLVDRGYDELQRGLVLGTLGLAATIAGTFLGGVLSERIGLGRGLWIFGALQIVSNVGYLWLAHVPPNTPALVAAMAFEMVTSGLGMGAFGVLLLRLTAKRFSATQYALFSSMFALPRVVGGPVTGFVVHEYGWTAFFVFTMVAGIPGLILLSRFVPLGQRDLDIDPDAIEPPGAPDPERARRRGLATGVLSLLAGSLLVALGRALRARGENGLPFLAEWTGLLRPEGVGDWTTLVGLLVFAAVCGLLAAASTRSRPL